MHRPDEDVEVYLHRVTCFVWMINSWSVCDTFKFAGGQRFVDRHAGRLWEYLKQWMNADGEYEVRFGVVMSMSYLSMRPIWRNFWPVMIPSVTRAIM